VGVALLAQIDPRSPGPTAQPVALTNKPHLRLNDIMTKKSKEELKYWRPEEVQSYHEAYHKSLNDAINANEKAFNEKIFYVSTGVVALSMTFVKELFGTDSSITAIYFLIAAWAGFAGAIISNIISYLLCIGRNRKMRTQFATHIENNPGMELCQSEIEQDEKHSRELIDEFRDGNKKAHRENWVTAIFFFAGVLTFIIFASINLININNMENDDKSSEVVTETGSLTLGEQAAQPCPVLKKLGDSISAASPTPIAKPSQSTDSDSDSSASTSQE
jgi:hypothetical protein